MAHTFYDTAPTDELLELYKKNNTFLIPTLGASATFTGAEVECSKELAEHHLAKRVLNEHGKACFCGRIMTAKEGSSPEFAYQTVRLLKKHGIDIIWSVVRPTPYPVWLAFPD